MATQHDAEIAHGWTVADAGRLARQCARAHPSTSIGFLDREAAAAYGIVAAILEADAEPDYEDLLAAGRLEITREVRQAQRDHGRDTHQPHREAGQFARYWHGERQLVAPWEDRVIERVALYQILPMLTAGQLAAVEALAWYDTYADAADSLDMRRPAFVQQLFEARRRFRWYWHEGETAPGMWGRDRRGEHRDVARERSRTLRRAAEQDVA